MSANARVNIVGGSGYGGGELIRLLLGHPCVELAQVSPVSGGQPVHSSHPNLRPVYGSLLRFTSPDALNPISCSWPSLTAGPEEHRTFGWQSASLTYRPILLDSPEIYAQTYHHPHAAGWLAHPLRIAGGQRDAIRHWARAAGCNATAAILARPLCAPGWSTQRPASWIKAGLPRRGDAERGLTPPRAQRRRPPRADRHRHEAEVSQMLGITVHLSVTSIELVRGVLATAHAWVDPSLTDKDLWHAYRATYGNEPFVRIVHERSGIYRHPEPKLLAGTNLADVGWELQPDTGRLVALAALDNLGKGAAGSAVQCMNVMMDWDERSGLEFPGLHPI
jgi:N-acetyl-gamma-glutamyl-phosphate/LysW-gamma-L-alpha-aminoadipyl-6-phosphate reductase